MSSPQQYPWPPIGYEEHPWHLYADAPVSRRQRLTHTGPYWAAVTPPTARLTPRLPGRLVAECEEAAAEIARFDADTDAALGTAEIAPLPTVLLRSESAASSQIEHLTVGARQLALAEIGHDASRNATTVAGNVHAMQAAIRLADAIGPGAILAVHRALMGTEDPHAGRWRTEQVWVGGTSAGPHLANFVAIHHRRIPEAIDDLVAFMGRTDIPLLAQTAISHAQFETIHPFTDGNGRTGRALIHAFLRHTRLTRRVTVPLSAGLLADVDAYFDALTSYREGDVEPIVERVVEASWAAVANGRRLLDDLTTLRLTWREALTARHDAAAWGAIDAVLGQPVVDTAYLSHRLGVSLTAAQTAIDHLVAIGALTATDAARRRRRTWTAPDVTRILDDFATRAGRRRTVGHTDSP